MRPEVEQEVRDWLTRAERNLLMAERALDGLPVIAEGAAFHSQQAAERALKAFLVAQSGTFGETQDLVVLIAACAGSDAGFLCFAEICQQMTPYAVRFRYPGGPVEPELAEAELAVHEARAIVRYVQERVFGERNP